MESRTRKHLDHQTPEWVCADATCFITICTKPRGSNQLCHRAVGACVLDSIRNYHDRRKWFCHVAVLMPDHVHFLLSFPDIESFSPVVGDWKRWVSIHHPILWQENFFEHRIRSDNSDRNKADYILHNPVRAGLVQDWKEWPYVWLPEGEW